MAVVSEKIENFIKSLHLPRDIAVILLKSDEDCHLFFEGFFMKNKYIVDDLLDFREHKIKKSKITLDLFLEGCYNNGMKESFESTFYQSFSIFDIEKIAEAIIKGKTSLEILFNSFKENPNKNILKNVL